MTALRAFVVEDSPVILDSLKDALAEMANVQVIASVPDEASAIDWMSRDPAHGSDLIIVDIFLRAGTGIGVLQAASRLGVQARRVVLTNFASANLRERCTRLGAERVFDKSHQLDDLIGYCAELASQAGAPRPS